MRSLCHVGALCVFSVSLSAGCAGNHDALEKRITSLQNDVSRLQNHGDRLEERLEALELRKDTPPPAASASDKVVDHPPLKVVKLEPQTSDSAMPSSTPVAELAAGDAVDDKAPRPMIRIHGSRVDGDADSAGGAPRRRGE